MPLEVLLPGELGSPGIEVDMHSLGCVLTCLLPPFKAPFKEVKATSDAAFLNIVKVQLCQVAFAMPMNLLVRLRSRSNLSSRTHLRLHTVNTSHHVRSSPHVCRPALQCTTLTYDLASYS